MGVQESWLGEKPGAAPALVAASARLVLSLLAWLARILIARPAAVRPLMAHQASSVRTVGVPQVLRVAALPNVSVTFDMRMAGIFGLGNTSDRGRLPRRGPPR
jgi:hypothetical protein